MSAQWYACRVDPLRDRKAERKLMRLAVDTPVIRSVYRPTCESWLVLPGCGLEIRKTLVPGYVFVLAVMDEDLAAAIVEIDEVYRLLPNSNHPVQIAEQAMAGLRRECEKLVRQTGETPDLDWMLGKTFRIKGGTFAGLEGACLSFDQHDRPIIWVEIFKRLTGVTVEVKDLDLVPVNEVKTQDAVDISDKFRDKRLTKRRKSPNHSETAVGRSAAALAAKS